MAPHSNPSLRSLDLEHVWHPCTQMKDHEAAMPLIPIRSGRGVWLEDYDGKRYIDAISSWWVNLWGHAHPHINAAVARQLEQLPHVLHPGVRHRGLHHAEGHRLWLRPPSGPADPARPLASGRPRYDGRR